MQNIDYCMLLLQKNKMSSMPARVWKWDTVLARDASLLPLVTFSLSPAPLVCVILLKTAVNIFRMLPAHDSKEKKNGETIGLIAKSDWF